ncbi:hypothetical protein [Modestobacter sp. Leaf380]|uniref:hypothetical protein n=1 Tax=Modestobacter sp. Leaf380 TaxID=1736356 RepID=UPI0006FDEBE6|nr:hypothetical protein [Modestobacter sp. Leaf380]KQS66244.1 hypothetical protein ASG41_13045 [Modestobacter sp. Leaf380]
MGEQEVSVTVEDRLYKFDHELTMIEGVACVSIKQVVAREMLVEVGLAPFDWDVRAEVVAAVDDFARSMIDEISVVLDVLDAADVPLAHTA